MAEYNHIEIMREEMVRPYLRQIGVRRVHLYATENSMVRT